MPCLSVSFSPRLGPLIQVTICEPGTDISQVPAGSLPKFTALVDTGASCTSISRTIINTINLQPVGKQPVGGVHGMQPTYLYQFIVGLIFFPGPKDPAGTTQPTIVPFSVLGAAFVPGQAPFDVLLGRDVLCHGVLTMAFDGRMTFSV